jgi:flavodoxin
MKAAILVESLTGNTWKAGERIAADLEQVGWTIGGIDPVRRPGFAAIQEADLVLVGTWVHGAFVVGQAPWGLGTIGKLPSMRGKYVAAFATYALNPGKAMDRMARTMVSLRGDYLGGVAMQRKRLEEHSEEFVGRLLDNIPTASRA